DHVCFPWVWTFGYVPSPFTTAPPPAGRGWRCGGGCWTRYAPGNLWHSDGGCCNSCIPAFGRNRQTLRPLRCVVHPCTGLWTGNDRSHHDPSRTLLRVLCGRRYDNLYDFQCLPDVRYSVIDRPNC